MKNIKPNLQVLLILALLFSSCSKVTISTDNSYETVNFPDGSFAYLNKNSSVEFNQNFTERIVKQKGEVFYEVKKGTNPFIVKAETGEVKVLGTKFNAKSTENDLEVDVESGSVEVKVNKLVESIKKGQKAVFKETENRIKLAKSELKHKQWIRNLKKDFKKLGKEIGNESKQLKKESKEIGKEVTKGFNKLKKKINN
ncbi:FecR family protein [Marinifilum flexuosum]|uniref:FecR family protein n=1 Tax=Marinifilum flexuosum TaxID=1117708 RepID=UPI0024946A27|nr:FecR domain-containing protein [Marinifilum flexuosum]